MLFSRAQNHFPACPEYTSSVPFPTHRQASPESSSCNAHLHAPVSTKNGPVGSLAWSVSANSWEPAADWGSVPDMLAENCGERKGSKDNQWIATTLKANT